MNDNYIDALNYAIKEEIADHYFHDRKVIDEELAELGSVRAATADLEETSVKLLADLASLLINSELWVDFWKLVQVRPPSLTALPFADNGIWEEIGNGFGWKSRYKGRVKRLAAKVVAQTGEYLKAHQDLAALIAEVNDDIARFNQNHDFLTLRSVLGEMDQDLVAKKYWLGASLEGEACLDLGRPWPSGRSQRQSLCSGLWKRCPRKGRYRRPSPVSLPEY